MTRVRPLKPAARMIGCTIGILLVLAGLTGTAAAAPANGSHPAAAPAGSPLAACTSAAESRKLDRWSCLGGVLTWESPVADKDGQYVRSERIAAEVAGPPTAIAADDDYDYWCENGSVCTRKISAYISETKGNGTYGDSNGSIGRHDLIIRTSLNGRQANWNVSVIWDGGPNIYFSNFNVNCREDQLGPDSNCGVFRAIGNGNYIGPGRVRVNSGIIYGNRLNDANPYYATLGGYFTPDGYPRFTFGTLTSGRWNCPKGTGNCTFP